MARLERLPESRFQEARSGSNEALGTLLESCRGYLLMIALDELSPDLRTKVAASDLVQETFVDAKRDFARFRGSSEIELRAWLRVLLLNNLGNVARDYRGTAKRDVRRELAYTASDSAGAGLSALPDDLSSPSTRAIKLEQSAELLGALGRIPEDYRQVLLLRHQEELGFDEIARIMARSTNAVQKLWVRAVECVRRELKEEQ